MSYKGPGRDAATAIAELIPERDSDYQWEGRPRDVFNKKR